MPKKAARSTKRARRPAKKSFLEKLFTFPKLALFAFVVLGSFTVYQITKPESNVMGASISNDEASIISEAEEKALVKTAGSNPYTVHQVWVFLDNKPKDGKYDEVKENCVGETVTLYVDNGNKVREFPGIWGCGDPIRIKTKSREITVGIKPISGYRVTGLTYRDQRHPNDTTVMGASKIKVKGFLTYGQYYTVINFGFRKK